MERKLGVVVHTFNPSTNGNNRNAMDIKSCELSLATTEDPNLFTLMSWRAGRGVWEDVEGKGRDKCCNYNLRKEKKSF